MNFMKHDIKTAYNKFVEIISKKCLLEFYENIFGII